MNHAERVASQRIFSFSLLIQVRSQVHGTSNLRNVEIGPTGSNPSKDLGLWNLLPFQDALFPLFLFLPFLLFSFLFFFLVLHVIPFFLFSQHSRSNANEAVWFGIVGSVHREVYGLMLLPRTKSSRSNGGVVQVNRGWGYSGTSFSSFSLHNVFSNVRTPGYQRSGPSYVGVVYIYI